MPPSKGAYWRIHTCIKTIMTWNNIYSFAFFISSVWLSCSCWGIKAWTISTGLIASLCEIIQHTTSFIEFFLERGISFIKKSTCTSLSLHSSMKRCQRGSYIHRFLMIMKSPSSGRCNNSKSCCYVHLHINTRSNFLLYIYLCKPSSYWIYEKVPQSPKAWSHSRFTALKFMSMPPKENSP